MVRERPWTAALFPLLFVIPFVTFANYIAEVVFNYRWSRRAERVGATPDLAL